MIAAWIVLILTGAALGIGLLWALLALVVEAVRGDHDSRLMLGVVWLLAVVWAVVEVAR